MSKDLVIKANALVEASYHLTANEQRLILSAIAKIPKNQSVTDDEVYFISAKDMIKLGLNETTAYRELYEAGKRLFSRSITIKTSAGTLKTRWVQDLFKFDENELNFTFPVFDFETPNEVSIGIRFNRSILPFLNNLTSNFTKYKLAEIASFSGIYSYRIYEFMMQYQSTGYVKINLSDLRARLQLDDKYPATKDLKVRVIDIAIREINKKSSYKVDYQLIKTGRKFTHLELKFKKKENNNPSKDNILKTKIPKTTTTINMTDKQRLMFANKLSRLPECSHLQGGNESYEALASFIAKDLLDPQRIEFYQPLLALVGFKER